MKIIGHIKTDFSDKFGIPRQSNLVPELKGKIVFEPEYRNPDAVRRLNEFTYIWLLWKFSKAVKRNWAATVRPPRLGGNTRVGVFATRSPYRPNGIGLSSVKLDKVALDEENGPVLYVSGIDLLDGTPIYDIKPYIPYTDCHPDASDGFTTCTKEHRLKVTFPQHLLEIYPYDKRDAILGVLAHDPRPAYIQDSEREYGVTFAGYDVKFKVNNNILFVLDVVPIEK